MILVTRDGVVSFTREATMADELKQLRIEHAAMVALLRRVATEVLPHEYGDLAEDAQAILDDLALRAAKGKAA